MQLGLGFLQVDCKDLILRVGLGVVGWWRSQEGCLYCSQAVTDCETSPEFTYFTGVHLCPKGSLIMLQHFIVC